jgi:hypothetical protein
MTIGVKKVRKFLEEIVWIDATGDRPDDDVTVLIFAPNADEPVWPGYCCTDDSGTLWFWADGSEIHDRVSHYAEMPAGPREGQVPA